MSWTNPIRTAWNLLFRRTAPGGSGGMELSDHMRRWAGQVVDEKSALSYSAYWCCVRVLTETIGQMPWRVYEVTSKGRVVADMHPADRLLYIAPNTEQDACTWRELMLRWVLSWGNAYCEIVRDYSFRPIALWPIHPNRVLPVRAGDELWYEVQQPAGLESVMLPSSDVLHFRGLGDELAGWSVLRYMARCLGLGIAQEVSMASQQEHGARLSGLLTPPGGGTIGETKAKSLQDSWNAQNAGSRHHGKVIMLPLGMEYKQLAMPNTDAQMIESRQFSVLDVCRFLRVPPHKVYELTRATFSNITHQSLEFLIDSLGPWVVKMEQQGRRKLISPQNWRRYETLIDSTAILRMDPATRIEYLSGLFALGAINSNEIREAEGFNNIGPDGDQYMIPVNLQTLERAGLEPAPAEPPSPPADQAAPAGGRFGGNGQE